MKWIKYLAVVIAFISLYSFEVEKNGNSIADHSASDRETVKTGTFNMVPEMPAPKTLEKILALNQARIGNSGQILLVTNEEITSKDVLIQTFEKTGEGWVKKFNDTKGKIGKLGFAPYKEKREGDKRTPSGIFFLGPVYTAEGEKVSTKMEHWVATENDYWIDDTKSSQYNRWVTSERDPDIDGVSREEMVRTQDGKYRIGIAVQYNMDQVVPKGSVITVHILENNQYTVGCIAVPEYNLKDIIGWLDPAKKPLIIMGTVDELLTKPVSGPGLDDNDKYVWKREQYPSK